VLLNEVVTTTGRVGCGTDHRGTGDREAVGDDEDPTNATRVEFSRPRETGSDSFVCSSTVGAV